MSWWGGGGGWVAQSAAPFPPGCDEPKKPELDRVKYLVKGGQLSQQWRAYQIVDQL